MSEKILLRSKKDFDKIKDLLNEGKSSGHIKKFYGVSQTTSDLIKNNRIDYENDKVKCEICNKNINPYYLSSHIKNDHDFSYDDYKIKYSNAKLNTMSATINRSKKATGKLHSNETKEKLKQASMGRKHSEETLKKLSDMSKGDKNPACRPDVKKILKEKHVSNIDPKRWEKMCKKIGDAQKGKKMSPERLLAIAEGKMKSAKFGSKAQLYCFEYLRKYFSIYHKTKVFSNDIKPFNGKKFGVDISIPKHRIAIEWDGVYHRKSIHGELRLKYINNNDVAKTKLLEQNGWKLIRVKDECKNGHKWREYVKQETRKLIKDKLLPMINDREIWENWKNDYPTDLETRIKLKNLKIPQKPCETKGCDKEISVNSKTGLCANCRAKKFRKNKKLEKEKINNAPLF